MRLHGGRLCVILIAFTFVQSHAVLSQQSTSVVRQQIEFAKTSVPAPQNSTWVKIQSLRDEGKNDEADKMEDNAREQFRGHKWSLAESPLILRGNAFSEYQQHPYEPHSPLLAAKLCLCILAPDGESRSSLYIERNGLDDKIAQLLDVYPFLSTDDQRVLAPRLIAIASRLYGGSFPRLQELINALDEEVVNAVLSGKWIDGMSYVTKIKLPRLSPQPETNLLKMKELHQQLAKVNKLQNSELQTTAINLVRELQEFAKSDAGNHKKAETLCASLLQVYKELPQCDRHALSAKILFSVRRIIETHSSDSACNLAAAIANDAEKEDWLTLFHELYELDYIVAAYLRAHDLQQALVIQQSVVHQTDYINDTAWMSCADHDQLAVIYEKLGRISEAHQEYAISLQYGEMSPTAYNTVRLHALVGYRKTGKSTPDDSVDSANSAFVAKSWTSEKPPTSWEEGYLKKLKWREFPLKGYTLRVGKMFEDWNSALQFVKDNEVVMTEYTPPAEYICFVDPKDGKPADSPIVRDVNHDRVSEVAFVHLKLNDPNYHMYTVYTLEKTHPELVWKSAGTLGNWAARSRKVKTN